MEETRNPRRFKGHFSSNNMRTLQHQAQKLIIQLEIQGEVIEQEDMNLKLLRSLPSEWKTHALIWRNKADIETISLDDLYNNLKIYKPELTGSSRTSQNLQNVAFVSSNSTSSTNEADNTAFGVSTAHSQELEGMIEATKLKKSILQTMNEWHLHLQEVLSVKILSDVKTVESKHESINVKNKGVYSTIETKPVRKNSFSPPIIKDWNSDDESETVESKHESINVKNKGVYSTIETKPVRKNSFSPPIIKDWNSDDESEVEFIPKVKVKTVRPSIEKIKFVKSAREKVKKVETAKQHKHYPRGNQRNWNNLMSQRLGSSFKMINKACFICGSFEHLHYVCDQRVGNPQQKEYTKKEVIDSGCSRHMTGNKCYISDYEDYDGGFVSFGDDKGRIYGRGKIKTRTLDFDDVYFCKELNVDLMSVVPTGGLTCLYAKVAIDESNLWHRRLGHINYKTMNKLVRRNLVRGLPLNIFENAHGCVACHKGKQHKASYKAKLVNSISKTLHMLHMDQFGPINVKSLMKKSYCLVITDDFSRFSWVFFFATKDATSKILKTFRKGIENQLDCKVKVIRCDNRTEFKNSVMNQLCDMKGIKREFSVARTLQHNGVAERKNRTLIETARTMLVDSKLPTTFWAEVVNTACYVLNRALVIKPQNKTPYELIRRRPPLIDFMKPFGCPVTILNTMDSLGKFDEKAYEGFFRVLCS
nr:hypothetical protein [Tanacetum cinerariifolium]